MTHDFLHGTVHQARADLQTALRSDPLAFAHWQGLTPLGRNEFICWVDDAKQSKTRERRIQRTCAELLEGKKWPCCWAGCIHRTDKAPSRWQQSVLIDERTRRAFFARCEDKDCPGGRFVPDERKVAFDGLNIGAA